MGYYQVFNFLGENELLCLLWLRYITFGESLMYLGSRIASARIGVAFFPLARAHYSVPTSQRCCNIAQSFVLTNFLSRKLSDKGKWSYYVQIIQIQWHFFSNPSFHWQFTCCKLQVLTGEVHSSAFWLRYVVYNLTSMLLSSSSSNIHWFWKTSTQASPTWQGLTWPRLHMSHTYHGHRLNLFYSCFF